MNWVLAILAFAGLMAVFSTIVSAVVELFHKVFALRSRGLMEMLRSMHDSMDIDEEYTSQRRGLDSIRVKGHTKDADRFAKDMSYAPGWGGRMRWWWPSRWGVALAPRRLEHLTKRQFAEQLAQTEVGQSLAKRSRSDIKRSLARAGYQFDRYGEAQSVFFGRKAKMISGLVAFTFVIFANVNAVQLYMHLAHEDDGLSNTLSYLGFDQENSTAAIAAYNIDESLRNLTALSEDIRVSSEAGVADPQSLATFNAARADLTKTMLDLEGATGMPLGHNYFPYCGSPDLDVRCEVKIEWQQADAAALALNPDAATSRLPGTIRTMLASPGESFVWILSMVATAGLLGLGAPFWYQLFNRAASLAGGAASAQIQQLRAAQAAEAANVGKPPDPMVHGKRGEPEPDIEGLADAFLLSAGRLKSSTLAEAPLGRRLGAASAEAAQTASAPTAAGGTSHSATEVASVHVEPAASSPAGSGIRRVRGDWSGSR